MLIPLKGNASNLSQKMLVIPAKAGIQEFKLVLKQQF